MADLITVDQYKTYAAITSTTNDDRIEQIISFVSSLIKTYCGRSFIDNYSEPKVHYTNGDYNYVYLTEIPLVDIVSVEYSGDFGETYSELTKPDEWVWDKKEDALYIRYPISGINAYRINYYGGYEETPPDLAVAACDAVTYYMKSENNPKKSIGFVSVEYITTSDFPSHIKRVLDLYRIL